MTQPQANRLAAPPAPQASVAAMFATALQLRSAGRLPEAEDVCRRLVQANARHADGLHLLGVLRAQRGDLGQAVEFLRKATEADPRVPPAWFNYANICQAAGRRADAIDAYRRAVNLKADFVDAHIALGRLLAEEGRIEEAQQSFHAVLGLSPTRISMDGGWGGAMQASGLFLSYRPDSDIAFGLHPELTELFPKWVVHNELNNSGDLARLFGLLVNIKQVLAEHVPGDFAELGVYRGNSAAVLAHFSRRAGRHLHLFDTFEGFDQKDLKGIDAGRATQFDDTSLGLVREVVGDQGVSYIEGYFPASIPAALAEVRFAVVHVDCDLYEPFVASLDFFYPRLSPGGLLIMHDYGSGYFPGARKAVDEFVARIPEQLVLWPDKSGTAVLRKNK
jgi:tetratricopeptide (TPR) repeat protein